MRLLPISAIPRPTQTAGFTARPRAATSSPTSIPYITRQAKLQFPPRPHLFPSLLRVRGVVKLSGKEGRQRAVGQLTPRDALGSQPGFTTRTSRAFVNLVQATNSPNTMQFAMTRISGRYLAPPTR